MKFIDALEAGKRNSGGREDGQNKQGGASMIASADKQAASTIAIRNAAIHRQDAKKLSPSGFIREDVEDEGVEEDDD